MTPAPTLQFSVSLPPDPRRAKQNHDFHASPFVVAQRGVFVDLFVLTKGNPALPLMDDTYPHERTAAYLPCEAIRPPVIRPVGGDTSITCCQNPELPQYSNTNTPVSIHSSVILLSFLFLYR